MAPKKENTTDKAAAAQNSRAHSNVKGKGRATTNPNCKNATYSKKTREFGQNKKEDRKDAGHVENPGEGG